MSNYNIWELLDKQYKKFPGSLAGTADNDMINKAEEKLSLKFNDQFKRFLSNYGGGYVSSLEIFGIMKANFLSNPWSLIENNNFFKVTQKWPDIEDWIVISDDGSGNPIGLLPNGEVWLSDHDSNFEKIKLANSFEDFLYKLLTDTLYEDDE